MKRQGLKVEVVACATSGEAVGINTRVDLAEANKLIFDIDLVVSVINYRFY